MEIEDLKIVIQFKGKGRASVGLQAKGTDPFLQVLEGAGLVDVMAKLPEILAAASARWNTTPKNPTYERPPEPPRPAAPRNLASPVSSKTKGSKDVEQSSLL